MKILSCGVLAQHPLLFNFGFDEEAYQCQNLKFILIQQITDLYENGVKIFYTDCEVGGSMWFAEIVIALMEDRKDMQLVCVIPFENQAAKWTKEQRSRYYTILEKSSYNHMITAHYSISCQQLCGEYIVDHSNFLLAILKDNADMLDLQTLGYADSSGCGIIYIDPDNGTIIPVTVRV